MLGTLVLAGLIGLGACFGSWQRWLAVHLAVAAFTAPWIGNYVDHPPEFLSGPLSLRFLLGTPIGFIGGDSRVLLGLVVLIAWGAARQILSDPRAEGGPGGGSRPPATPAPTALASVFLLRWRILPPT